MDGEPTVIAEYRGAFLRNESIIAILRQVALEKKRLGVRESPLDLRFTLFEPVLHFRKRGGKVAAKKGKGSYDRKNFKKGVA